ncbi:MAG: hypothetical protein JRJ27_15155, partial [Deltaproteobacteria bacterium]|nr:hypothetical protein [Deltaproteobacteria bacterium]
VTFSLMNQLSKKQDAIIGLILLAGTILASIFFINFLVSLGPFMMRSLPLILFCLIVIEVIRLRFQYRQSTDAAVTILRLTLLIFALLLLLKIFFRVDPSQYGFALAMPGTIILVLLLVDWLPASLEQKGKTGTILRLFSIGIILIFCGIHILVSGFWYNKTTVEIKTDTASFYADVRGNIVQDIIKEIENHTSPEDTLAVLPEGVMLNFLTQRKNPTPYINFMPPEFALFGELNMLNAFQTNPPDYIVLTNKSLKEYGFQEAGIDIGVDLYLWIDKNYTLIKYIEFESGGDMPFTSMRLLHRIQPKDSNHLNPAS